MANKRYYECHVTFEPPPAPDGGSGKVAEEHVESFGWRFSAIDGDIVQGAGTKYYATRHFNEKLPTYRVLESLETMSNILSRFGYNVTRRKIELVIYDTRSSQVCPDDCLQCMIPMESGIKHRK